VPARQRTALSKTKSTWLELSRRGSSLAKLL